jgi:hypothetical protein
MNRSKFVLAAILVLGFSPSAHAQITYEPTWSPPDAMLMNNIQFNPVVNDIVDRGQTKQSSDGREGGTSQQTTAMPTYAPNKSRTRANLNALASRLGGANGQQAEQLFASNDVIGMVQGVMNQYGLQKNNVAHAYALYWVVYWGLANNVHDAPSERALQAVAAQAERGFANNAEFAQLDNAAKQAAAEELMALTAIFDATSEQAKSDPTLAAQIAKASLEGSRKSGLELDKMTLTEDGFVPGKPRKGANASDAVGDDTKQASANGNNKTLQYGIMAALGLGAAFMIGKGMKRG